MGITDNFVQLSRMKRDLGIVVDANPTSEYLNQTIICNTIKKYLKDSFPIDESNKIEAINEIAIEKFNKQGIKTVYKKPLDFFLAEATEIYELRKKRAIVSSIAKYYKVTYTKAEDYSDGIFEVKKVPRAMTIFKEYGVEALIWLLINKQQFNKIYPKAI